MYVVLAVHRSLPPVLSTYGAVLSKELGKSGLVEIGNVEVVFVDNFVLFVIVIQFFSPIHCPFR